MDGARENDRLLRAMLGPSGPELGCEECFEQLDRYVELELAGADADSQVPGMSGHLSGCPACEEDHQSLLALLRPRLSGAARGRASPRPPYLRAQLTCARR